MAHPRPTARDSDLTAKRFRREFEPEEKAWNDEALDMPWDDLTCISKHTLFAMKNIFFFSHATEVQSRAIPQFISEGSSVVVEAATGSGKTFSFLVPLLERIVARCDKEIQRTGRPVLHRKIVTVVLSPSKVLAEQTFLVAKKLSSRFPHNIRVALCDGVVEPAPRIVERLRKTARGAGTILVTTPTDLLDFLDEMRKPAESRDEYEEGDDRRPSAANTDKDELTIERHNDDPFIIAVDEADVIMRSVPLRTALCEFMMEMMDEPVGPAEAPVAEPASPSPAKGGKKKKGGKKAEAAPVDPRKPLLDIGFYGATVGTSTEVSWFADAETFAKDKKRLEADAEKKSAADEKEDEKNGKAKPAMDESLAVTVAAFHERNRTKFHRVALHTDDDFVSQLSNRYLTCPANSVLPALIHSIDVHPSRKHFVFFNSPATLKFVHKVFKELIKATRPVLHVKNIYVLHEWMEESAKFEQYNAFLRHQVTPTQSKSKEEDEAKRSIQPSHNHTLGAAKRSGAAPAEANGAMLLCTDIAAFGLDIRDVDYCYHFEAPGSVQSYIHRIGRVGRMGMRGSSLLILPSSVGSDEDGKDSEYLANLKTACELTLHRPPPSAPITTSVRNAVADTCVKEGRRAAMEMAKSGLINPREAIEITMLD